MRTSIDPAVEAAVAKARCERDHLFFTRYFFKHRQGIKFRVNWHHGLICDTVQRVIDGELKNVVINVPPGSSKTELVAINLIARGLALNPRARFLHISYSDDLALLNSETAREIVQSEEYQALWPLAIADDAKSKKRWNIIHDGKKAGGVYAVSLGGQITGFRAGHMADGWQGAIIIDDPLKVEDAYSKTKRATANRKLISTVKSRKANPDTPIIVIMQRLAEEDPTGFIKAGKVPGEWEFVTIPALIDDEYVAELPEPYRALIDGAEQDEQGRFSYWLYKEPLADLLELEAKDRYVFTDQYQQRPSPLGGDIIQGKHFGRYTVVPALRYRKVFADTAQKTEERHDYSVFQCWGLGEDGRIYLLDMIRGKWPAPELKRRAIAFWGKHRETGDFDSPLRQLLIEDKSSGTGLIQDIQASGGMTRLFGQSAAGLNASGDNDVRNYYDMVSARQEAEPRPPMETLYEVLVRSELGHMPGDFRFDFNPLWQLSETEQATVEKTRAERDKSYLDAGVVTEALVARELKERGTYLGMALPLSC